MATQKITVLKIIGKSADHLLEKFPRWQHSSLKQIKASDKGRVPSPKTVSCIDDVRILANQLDLNSAELPITFYRQYIDTWSMGDEFSFKRVLKKGYFEVYFDDTCMLCFDLKFRKKLRAQIKHSNQSLKGVAEEKRWYHNAILEGDLYGRKLYKNKQSSLLIVIRKLLGFFVTDEEVLGSAKTIPTWLSLNGSP